MQAVVLSRQDFKEHDQIISFYTRTEGRRDLLARGVKRIVSKNAAQLEPCSVVEIGVAKGKDMDILTSVQIETYFSGLRKNYYQSLLGMWAVDVIKKFFISPEREDKIFVLMRSWLCLVDAHTEISPYMMDAFVLRILGYLGFVPVLNACVGCKRKRVSDLFFFSPVQGGIVCGDCRYKSSTKEKWHQLSRELITSFESLIFSSWDKLFDLSHEKRAYMTLHMAIFDFLQYHHETFLPDWWKLAKLSKKLM